MSEARNEERLRNYKKGVDLEDGRRRREETQVSIRKQKKDERLSKRRTAPTSDPISTGNAQTLPEKKEYTPHDLPKLVQVLADYNGPMDPLIEAARAVRRMLSASHSPPVKEVLAGGALPYLVALLMRVDSASLQFEAAWALTNIASTDYTCAVADEPNAIKYLIDLLRSPDANVREQCAWCLGNIAGDGAEYRDRVLRLGAINSLLLNIQDPANDSLLQNVTWTISNLCRGKPLPELEILRPAIPVLACLATKCMLDAIKADALWALSYISDGDDSRIEAIIQSDSEIPALLVKTVEDMKPQLVAPALRTLGNFVSGNEHHTQAVIDANVLEVAMRILLCPKKNLRKEMCWLLSNIAAGTQSQIAALMKNSDVTETLVAKAIESDWETRKEAIYAIANIFTGGSDTQVQRLVNQSGIQAMSDVLSIPGENRMIIVALEAIDNILTVSERNGFNYAIVLDEANGIDRIEELQQHDDNEVYEKAVYIIDRFFGEDDAEDENLAPGFNGDTYAFGLDSPPLAKNLFSDPISSSPNPAGSSFGGSNHSNFGF